MWLYVCSVQKLCISNKFYFQILIFSLDTFKCFFESKFIWISLKCPNLAKKTITLASYKNKITRKFSCNLSASSTLNFCLSFKIICVNFVLFHGRKIVRDRKYSRKDTKYIRKWLCRSFEQYGNTNIVER